MSHDWNPGPIGRATALGIIGGAAFAVRLGRYADASSSRERTPEGEIGPFFTDDSATGYDRSDIRTNLDGTKRQAGVPLALEIHAYDVEKGGRPYAGAQIDVWHCNAAGVYSNETSQASTGETWLRGYQLTDAAGRAHFTTIVPGWYDGRTTHVHLRVRSHYDEASSPADGSNTTQLFFPQAIVSALATSVAPYRDAGTNPTDNLTDRVFADETKGRMLLPLAGDAVRGFRAHVSIGLPIIG